MTERLPYVQPAEATMAEIKAVRLPSGDWQLLDQMTKAEVAAYGRQLARELAAGRAILAELEHYIERRWGKDAAGTAVTDGP